MYIIISIAIHFHCLLGSFGEFRGDFVLARGFSRGPGEAPCPKAWIKPGRWVERRVEGRDTEILEVKRPRLVLGLKMNKASLISEAG